jgi:hypothetical protein
MQTDEAVAEFFKVCNNSVSGVPKLDVRWFLYFPFTFLQLGVASIPVGLHRNWSILLVTSMNILLSLLSGSMGEWRREKFDCRRRSRHDYLITRGNGHKHVYLIKGIHNNSGSGLNLEDLAAARGGANTWTRALTVLYAVGWLLFLVTAGGLKEDAWYLIFVGTAGMVQNIFLAGARRSSASHGIPLNPVRKDNDHVLTYGLRCPGSERPGVMVVLRQVEKDLLGVGIALLHEFFPDHTLRDAEKTEWNALKASVKQRRAFELFERYECEDAVDREGLEVDMRCSKLS